MYVHYIAHVKRTRSIGTRNSLAQLAIRARIHISRKACASVQWCCVWWTPSCASHPSPAHRRHKSPDLSRGKKWLRPDCTHKLVHTLITAYQHTHLSVRVCIDLNVCVRVCWLCVLLNISRVYHIRDSEQHIWKLCNDLKQNIILKRPCLRHIHYTWWCATQFS